MLNATRYTSMTSIDIDAVRTQQHASTSSETKLLENQKKADYDKQYRLKRKLLIQQQASTSSETKLKSKRRLFFTRIAYTLLTCDTYKSSLRHIHDPVLLSLKMEGISLAAF